MKMQWKQSLLALVLGISCLGAQAQAAETSTAAAPAVKAVAPAAGNINVNAASVEQLATVKGLGPKKAQAIVDYRQKNGNFKTLDDLSQVPGIGDKLLASIKPHLSV